MIFSSDELFGLNSIIDKKDLLGINLKISEKEDTESFVGNTIASIQNKGIITDDKKISKLGFVVLKNLEEYKKARKHIVINDLNIALKEGQEAIAIQQFDEGYELKRVNKLSVILGAISKCDYMQKKTEEDFLEGYDENISEKELLQKDNNKNKKCFYIQEYLLNVKINDYYFFWDDNLGYRYNKITQNLKILSPRQMKKSIFSLLEFKEEV